MLFDSRLITLISIGVAVFYFHRTFSFFVKGSRIKILLKCILIGASVLLVLNLVNVLMSYTFIKIAASNPTLCYKFPQDDKDACLGWVAEERNDSSICFEIQKLNGRGSKNTCIYNVARKKHDVNLCKKISNSEKSNGTDHNSDYCLMAIAGDQGDPKICDQIQMITGPEFDDPAKAEDIASKERCYAEVGVTINDKFLCEKSGKYRDLCLKNIK